MAIKYKVLTAVTFISFSPLAYANSSRCSQLFLNSNPSNTKISLGKQKNWIPIGESRPVYLIKLKNNSQVVFRPTDRLEYYAFLFDQLFGFNVVPKTAYSNGSQWGTIQTYMKNAKLLLDKRKVMSKIKLFNFLIGNADAQYYIYGKTQFSIDFEGAFETWTDYLSINELISLCKEIDDKNLIDKIKAISDNEISNLLLNEIGEEATRALLQRRQILIRAIERVK